MQYLRNRISFMITIEDIRNSIAPELERLNNMIRLSLTTDSPLLQTVIDSYLKRTGKQIRPILSLLSAGV